MTDIAPINLIIQGLINDATELQKNTEKLGIITKALGSVEHCVRGYSRRNGFCGKLSGIMYRVWNAIKAIFCQSDWQKGRKALQVAGKEIASLVNIYEGKYDDFIANINLPVDWSVKDCDTFLRCLVKLNENPIIKKMTPEIRKSFDKEKPTIFASILYSKELKSFICLINNNLQNSGKISSEEFKANKAFSSKWMIEMNTTAIGKRLIEVLQPSF